ncbi:MAG TPA: S24 family peptidase [Bryobacteraceae bacterium]|nr:S24 family peptidase [Bryobacteraceae bacterium]
MPVVTTHSARFSVLAVALAGEAPENAGILLEDPASDRLYVRLRRDWNEIAPQEAEVFSAIENDLAARSAEVGAARLMDHLEATLSNALLVTDRREVMVEDFDRALSRLYREHVRASVREFVTHLPRYSLAVAAGKFLENREVTEEGWEEAPEDLKITRDMFAARIAGRSMEPKIPDGSLCVFRYGVAGSRQGRLVLVEQSGGGANDRYTVKRYRSVKRKLEDGSWSHERITLESLNPEFESWDLDPQEERFRILAEFVRVLD